jgi:hypothetical protein
MNQEIAQVGHRVDRIFSELAGSLSEDVVRSAVAFFALGIVPNLVIDLADSRPQGDFSLWLVLK